MLSRREILAHVLTALCSSAGGCVLLPWILPLVTAGFETFGWEHVEGR